MSEASGKYLDVKRLVVKIGTGFIYDKVDGAGYRFRGDQLDALVEETYEISKDRQLAIVSSGAITTAAVMRGLSDIPKDPYKKAQLAGIGQPNLFIEYRDRLNRHGKTAAQCLITRDDLNNEKRASNLIRNQTGYFNNGVMAIYNENDFVSIEEITFGDNDILAAKLTCAIGADLLVMLSVPTEGLGTGGGKSKEEARKITSEHGISMEILNGRYEKAGGIYLPKIRELF
ncbi:MAG: hypothetical protein V1836_02775 [Candidatus Aenigmatarchaeota archaeon]